MKYKIEVEVELPDDVSDDDVYDWARFELHENGRLDGKNPLIDHEIEALPMSVNIHRLWNE